MELCNVEQSDQEKSQIELKRSTSICESNRNEEKFIANAYPTDLDNLKCKFEDIKTE